MATKNLARTVIEGGRARFNKFDRRYSNRQIRRKVRQYAHRIRLDPDGGEGSAAPIREPVWRAHHDRLAAAERWLASFVGRPWNDARAEIARRFNTRTVAGQHIVFDHLLPSVLGSGRDFSGRHDFEIDEEGVLQRLQRPRRSSPWKLPPGKLRPSPRQIDAWARSRLVGRRGPGWFWFQPTGHVWKTCTDPRCWRDHVEAHSVRRHQQPNGRYRQTYPLSADDVRYFAALLEDVQERLIFPLDEEPNP